MKTKQLFMALALAMATHASAQTNQGGITVKMLEEIKGMQTSSPAEKALRNAIAGNAIDDLAKNYNAKPVDNHFSVETKRQSITNQQSSGRCWMFSGFNVLRSNFAQRTDSLRLELSHSYLFFYDQLEKANLFLQGVIDHADKPMDDQRVQFFFKHPVGDGGTFCGVADLVDKYGIVPKEVMPETHSSDNTSRMAKLITSKLREYGLLLRKMAAEKAKPVVINAEKTRMLATIYRMLSMTIGEPPTSFTYAFKNESGRTVTEEKKYTPLEFAKEVVGGPITGTFIMAMNDPRRPYYKTYEVEYDRHTYDGTNWKYINLPMDDIEKMAIASLKDGRKLYSSYDVAKLLDRKQGYADLDNYDYGALFGTSFTMNKADRISTFDSGSTHAMTLTAVDLDENGKATQWKVENSWGAAWGQQGCMIMSDRWWREYTFRLVVDKKYVPENILKASEQAPIMVMPEDPLFLGDE